MNDISRFRILFTAYTEKTCTDAERAELFALIRAGVYQAELEELVSEHWDMPIPEWQREDEEQKAELLFQQVLEQVKVKKLNPWRRWMVAASIVLIIGLGSYVWLVDSDNTKTPTSVMTSDAAPGKYKARLTLADGRVIVLDSAELGELATQGNTAIINKEGQLVYDPAGANGGLLYNTVTTAKGETFALTLSDGSQVWLNSGSSIYFPVVFPEKERRIEITGEVYVKVAPNKLHPFIAAVNGMEVRALGTEFNINAYPDEENLSATLIEGLVKVNATLTLQPGQQTQFTDGKLSPAKQVNIEETIAWKNGWFHFESADLKTILRQFARWYDVEVIYEGQVSDEKFFSIMSRNTTLSNVLKSLQANDIKFRIEGKKLFVQSG